LGARGRWFVCAGVVVVVVVQSSKFVLFVGSLVRWFVGSLVRWFVGSLVRWFVGSLVRWFVGSLVRSSVGSFVRSLLHCVDATVSVVSSVRRPLGRGCGCSELEGRSLKLASSVGSIHSLARWLSLLVSLVHSLVSSFRPWFADSLTGLSDGFDRFMGYASMAR